MGGKSKERGKIGLVVGKLKGGNIGGEGKRGMRKMEKDKQGTILKIKRKIKKDKLSTILKIERKIKKDKRSTNFKIERKLEKAK